MIAARRTKKSYLRKYFELGAFGAEAVNDGLMEVPFGEYLIDKGALSREQLFMALSTQDLNPGVPLGEIISALGYMVYPELERMLGEFNALPTVEVA